MRATGYASRLAMLAIAAAFAHPAGAAPASLLDFELKRLEAPEIRSLRIHAGEPVLVLFFEPDCSWCWRQVKAVNELRRRPGVKVAAVAIGVHGSRLQLQRELRRLRPGFAAYEASPQLLAAIGGIEATPFILLGDAAGRPTGWIRGYATAERLAGALVTPAGKPVTPSASVPQNDVRSVTP